MKYWNKDRETQTEFSAAACLEMVCDHAVAKGWYGMRVAMQHAWFHHNLLVEL